MEPELWQPLLQGKLVGERETGSYAPGWDPHLDTSFVMQRRTLYPATRVLALQPQALVKAQGEQSPGTTLVSGQVSLGSPEWAMSPGGSPSRGWVV